MSDLEDDTLDMDKSNQFLASMSTLEGGRRRFLHGTDESQVLDKPLSEIIGAQLTVQSLLFNLAATKEIDGDKKKKKKKKKKNLKELEEQKLEGDIEKIYKKTVEKSKEKLSLAAPLTTPQAQKAGRTAVYEKVSKEVAQWDAVIHSRRAAPTVTFPLEKPELKLKSIAQHSSARFTPRTPLEIEVMAALHGGLQVEEPDSTQKLKAGLTLKEQWQQMQEMARLKAHLRYQEAKISRQNKIKSKSYRRHLRKQKAKEREKELQELQNSNPEFAAEQMAEQENNRTLERATLKHSKANKNKKLAFKTQADRKSGEKKTNQATKAIVDTMTAKKRELMSKARVATDDEDSDIASDNDDAAMLNGDEKEMAINVDVLLSEEKNPWIKTGSSNNDENSSAMKEKMQKMLKDLEQKSEKAQSGRAAEVNPNDFAFVKEKRLLQVADDGDSDEEDDVDSGDEEKRQQIGQIFAEDNLIAEEFEAEKLSKNRQKKTKVELALPGWGSWSGEERKGRRKRSRPMDKVKVGVKVAKVDNAPVKKDNCTRQEHVILSNDKTGVRGKQTSSVPFPFTSVADFEASLRLPLGDTFIPRTSHKKVIQPKVKIPLGSLIEPMDKQVLVKRGILPANTLDMHN